MKSCHDTLFLPCQETAHNLSYENVQVFGYACMQHLFLTEPIGPGPLSCKLQSLQRVVKVVLAALCTVASQLEAPGVLQVVNVLGFSLPFYKSPTLLLSLGLSIRVFWYLVTRRPDVIHVSSPGLLVFSAIMYAKLLAIPLVVSYHTHIPEYIPKYTGGRGLVEPMWNIIRYCTLVADLTLVPSQAMKVISLLSYSSWLQCCMYGPCTNLMA